MSNGIKWLDDIQAFYRERAVIEREYSQRLRYAVRPRTEERLIREQCVIKEVFREEGQKVGVTVCRGYASNYAGVIRVCFADDVDHYN